MAEVSTPSAPVARGVDAGRPPVAVLDVRLRPFEVRTVFCRNVHASGSSSNAPSAASVGAPRCVNMHARLPC